MVSRIPMSRKGYKNLREELERLEKKERPDVVRAIEVARQHGDLSENAEYHAAKERQGMIEGRIIELKDKLARAEVIDCSKVECDRAVFGTVVTLVDMDTDEEITYQLLGPEEADVKKVHLQEKFGLPVSLSLQYHKLNQYLYSISGRFHPRRQRLLFWQYLGEYPGERLFVPGLF